MDILFVCPYCGTPYGGRRGCCGESHAHGVYVIDCEGDEELYATYAEAWDAAANKREE